MPDDADRIHPDILYTPAKVAKLDRCCVALVYRRLSAGEYRAFKDGRSTRILGASILERRAARLKPARFKAPLQGPRFHTINQEG
jgi:hypothetical protein